VHRLRDCELREGAAQAAVLQRFLEVAGGRVLVFHHAPLDLAFLDKACTQLFAAPLLMPTVDTLRLEHRQMTRREQTIGEGDLRLAACRERYGLPPHAAHSALDDALATAELLLAQLATRGTGGRLRDLS
jgi:DNA polymerase-3 subunit epsilon